MVSGIVVGASDQALNGTATRAGQQTAAARGGRMPFVSRAQWRRMFATNASGAHATARISPSWASLPERKRANRG
jgi:hypothetical protein